MKYWVPALLLFSFSYLLAQKPVQVIRGKVFDKISGSALSGAQIVLKDSSPLIGATSDEDGSFEIEGVTVGRYIVQIQYLGYEVFAEGIILKGGKPSVIEASLRPAFSQLEEVVIKDQAFITDPSAIGKRSVTIEQTRRFTANHLDPARVMISFPGVVPQNDQNNNLIINGKSPNGLLWRLEGLDIVNPNHLANAGTLNDRPSQNGGGVNILSTQMLKKSQFLTPAFSAGYGNVTSGVMDMSLRMGDKYDAHYTLQASLIGLDIAAEGPLAKERSSFLVNYRYSTVGILTQLGLDFDGEGINYQDFSFHLNFDQNAGGKLSIFGFWGNSKNRFSGPEDPGEWEYDKDSTDIKYVSSTAAIGFNEIVPLSKNTSFYTGSVLSVLDNDRIAYAIGSHGNASLAENYEARKLMISSKLEIRSLIHAKVSVKGGTMVNILNNNIVLEEPYRVEDVLLDGEMHGVLYQPYLHFNTALSQNLMIQGGLRYMFYNFNQSSAWLPHVSFGYKLGEGDNLILEYGNQAQLQLDQVYLSDYNKNLKMNKMSHLALGYHHFLDRSVLNAELFYEHQYDIPVSTTSGSFSLINGLNEAVLTALTNQGSGDIYGVNLTWEKPIYEGFYYLMSGSYYDATYKGSDGVKRDSRYNGKYTFSVMAGKEIGREKEGGILRVTGLNGRVYYAGGMRTSPILVEESRNNRVTVYDIARTYSEKLSDYLRIDLRVSFRKEKSDYTRVIAIDLQNLLSIENDGFSYYDFRHQGIATKKQLGIIPVLIYRIEF